MFRICFANRYTWVGLRDSIVDSRRPVNGYRWIGLLDELSNTRVPHNASAAAAQNVYRLRTQKGWSLERAAKAAGIGKSTFAQLETGTSNPSLETLWAVAMAFDVPIGSLIGSVHGLSRLVTPADRSRLQSDSHTYQIQMLLSLGPLRGVEISLLEIEPGPPRLSQPHLQGSVEHVFMIQGALRVSPGDRDASDLREGDLFSFSGEVVHSYEALEPGTRGLIIMQYT
jgi:transcriptional regulator with XRE-family HTH domain